MGKYIKKFDTHSDYEDFIETEDFIKPNVSYCIDNVEVHYNPYVDPYNGHAYVDLGLPSGTLWATMNVGANSETDYGLYFAWGETEGYTADQISGTATPHKAFAWSDYDLTEDSGSTMSKYNATDGKTVLDIEDDAVAANWGGSWKMPTEAQFQELLNTANCTNTWETVDGVNGRLFTSVRNGNTLFIPAAGDALNGSMYSVGKYGSVWSSSLSSSNVKGGRFLYFDSYGVSVYGNDRFCGQSVRGVVGGNHSDDGHSGVGNEDDDEIIG